jgi:hypothetical protein
VALYSLASILALALDATADLSKETSAAVISALVPYGSSRGLGFRLGSSLLTSLLREIMVADEVDVVGRKS